MRERAEHWPAIAAAILQTNDRSVAIGKIAVALQHYASEQVVPIDPLHAAFYALALARIEFFTLALELALHAEALDPPLVETSTDANELEEDVIAA